MTNKNYKVVMNGVWKYFSKMRGYESSIKSTAIYGCLLYLHKIGVLQCMNDINDINYIINSERSKHNINIPNDIYVIIQDCLVNNLNKNTKGTVSEIAAILNNVQQFDYLQEFDNILSKQSMQDGWILPKELFDLTEFLLGDSLGSVYNPFAGVGCFFSSLRGYNNYLGQEATFSSWQIGIIRLALSNSESNINYKLEPAEEWTNEKYDTIVATPPFRMKLKMRDSESYEYSDIVTLNRFDKTTTTCGRMVTFVPISVLYSEFDRNLRKKIVDSNFLESVIVLPGGLLKSTGISIAVLCFRKGRNTDSQIKFVDASGMYKKIGRDKVLDLVQTIEAYNQEGDKSKLINKEEIVYSDYNWNASHYVAKKTRILPEGSVLVNLDKLVEPIRLEREFDELEGYMVQVSELSADCFSFEKRPIDFPFSDNIANYRKLTEPALLISTIRQLKPTYCHASIENPVFLNPNLLAFRINSASLHIGYLCKQLWECENIAFGGIIPHIRVRDILNLEIALPAWNDERSIEEQKNIYEASKRIYIQYKADELGLHDYITVLKNEFMSLVRTRKHDMKPYLRQISSAAKLIRYNIQDLDSKNENVIEIKEALDEYEIAMKHLTYLIDHISDEQSFGQKQIFNIDEYFMNLQEHYDGSDIYELSYIYDEVAFKEYGLPTKDNYFKEKTWLDLITVKVEKNDKKIMPWFVEIAPIDFDRIVKNIIGNALMHGFIDNERKDYQLKIFLSIEPESQMYRIDFSNNGRPFPKGLDKIRFGIQGEKAGKTANHGEGGYIIKSILNHFGGDYELSIDGDYSIISIYLPIKETGNE